MHVISRAAYGRMSSGLYSKDNIPIFIHVAVRLSGKCRLKGKVAAFLIAKPLLAWSSRSCLGRLRLGPVLDVDDIVADACLRDTTHTLWAETEFSPALQEVPNRAMRSRQTPLLPGSDLFNGSISISFTESRLVTQVLHFDVRTGS